MPVPPPPAIPIPPPFRQVETREPASGEREQTAAAGPLVDFAAVYQQHSRAVYYLTLRWLGGDAARAEDAAHDVFLKAWRQRDSFRGGAEVRTWLYRIAINHCKTLRSTWHQRHIFLTQDGEFAESSLVDADTPLRVAEDRDLGRGIQTALETLPEEYRLLLLLVADQEMSYEEAAELTSQSTDAVRGKLYRARKAFAAAFRKIV